MVEGVDFECSYASVIDGESFLLLISIAAKMMTCYFIDVSNTFQKNSIADPSK